MAIVSVDGVENVRDLGGISVLDGRKVKSGLFFRGANLSGITPEGARALAHDLGVSLSIATCPTSLRQRKREKLCG